ncbi:putative tRNA-dihydrouridine synthase [Tritonibacter multivorans]|uniref:tRNA-dihydrouridine synthase n=1 Tax=Tritonibacter multivorans TaxID=928856 RepID=A0A0P1GJZ0_9RHOB|nr:tRNA dihydrouridine synthase DusB [Tritonibacter multivorans]MDA7421544.1 tRNA dihydrouridine synthase DusB [Tritonibacter multivorans]CUH82205.1 putative tRNA-dihydrouridine synthase [Tritonibacter multivorans]SFC96116.1 tRNA-U20-dihydrouridine synthase [Tritonibacter multivorans]
MSFTIGTTSLEPPIALAPMAGITDRPYRDLVRSFGVGLMVSEMVASQEMVQAKPGVRERAELSADVENTAVQLAGREATWMAEAARQVADRGAKVIDINMGCPAKKVTNGYSGSALLKTPDHALSLIEAVVAAVDVPVTLKTRLGWDDNCLNAPDVARRAQDAGVQMVTIHGRTRCQFYKGSADWQAISQVRAAIDVPLLANGDIVDTATARSALEKSGANGVMIGRGAQGKPWLLAQVAHDIWGSAAPEIPEGSDLVDMISKHYEAMLDFYGLDLGLRVSRKHLGWYMDEAETPAALRRQVLTAKTPAEVLALLPEAILGADKEVAA